MLTGLAGGSAMTEEEWLASHDWRTMMAHLTGKITVRKGMLYVCGGLRTLWELLYDDASRDAVSVAERAVDGAASQDELRDANIRAEGTAYGFAFDREFIREYMRGSYSPGVRRLIEMGVYSEADLRADKASVAKNGSGRLGDVAVVSRLVNAAHIAEHGTNTGNLGVSEGGLSTHLIDHLADEPQWPGCWLVHCIFGNPFRPVTFLPAWLTSTVVGIARGIYDDRAFDRLPILADALQDAGCEDAEVLAHCRSDGPHVRGCWVVDGVLGKE